MKIRFIQKFIETLKLKVVNKKLSRVKYVHLMFNDKFNKIFVDFINRNYNSKEHLFLCKRTHEGIVYPFPDAKNVIRVKTYNGINFSDLNVKKIIAHSFFDEEVINILYDKKDLLTKTYWMIWGGDLYDIKSSEKGDFVRKNVYGYITDVDGDAKFATEKYNSNPVICNAGYTFPITQDMLNNTCRINKAYTRIQINNSCDESTLSMLDLLSKFKDENIKITTVLSYGNLQFKDSIIEKGKELFGDKFDYIDKLIPFQDYANHLAQNDILILNQNRQQGLGNIFASLALGVKVFIKSDITTFKHLNEKDTVIFDTNKIKDFSFSEFINYPHEIKDINMSNSKKFFEDNYLKELWDKVFEDKESTIQYWQNRVKQFGKRSVYNMAHSKKELAKVDNFQENIYLNVLKKCLKGDEKVAVDFGCGAGRFEPMLSKLVKEKVVGIDPIAKLISYAPKLPNVEYQVYDNFNIKLPDNSVDIVFVSLVLGGIVNKNHLENCIKELKRISSENALFFIVENTAQMKNSFYWHYRQIDEYKEMFDFCNLELMDTYEDLGEEISILAGRKCETIKAVVNEN